MHAKSFQSCPTLCSPLYGSPPGSSIHGILSKNTGVGCHALLQGIFLTQGSNLHLLSLLHWQDGSLPPGGLLKIYIRQLNIEKYHIQLNVFQQSVGD